MNQGYPAIPAEGTGVGSLISVSDYERVTGDTTNSDQDVIDEAVVEVSQFCNRTLAYGQYTERLYVNKRGMVYPSALPLDPVTPVTLPVGGAVFGPAIFTGLYGALLPEMLIFSGVFDPQVDCQFWGGYQPYGTTDGPTPQLPPKLMQATCRVAFYNANPVTMVGVPAGATSVSLQGVSVSGMSGSISSWQNDASLVRTLRSFRRMEYPTFGN